MSEAATLIELCVRRWSFLSLLYDQREKRPSPSDLARQLEKTNQEISRWCRELEAADLIKLQTIKGERFKRCTFTRRGLRVVGRLKELLRDIELGEERELTDPSPDYWKELREELDSGSSWAAKAALEDLRDLCRKSRVWKLGEEFWNFLSEKLDANLNELIDCLLLIAVNASSNGEAEVAEKIKTRFYGKLKEILFSADRKTLWQSTLLCLKHILSEDEMLELLKARYEDAFKAEDEEEFKNVLHHFDDELRVFYETHNKEVRRWLYQKMKDRDPKVAERAFKLYRIIKRGSHLYAVSKHV